MFRLRPSSTDGATYNINMRQPHLLVVDDERKMCLSLQELLEKHQCRVTTALSAREAFAVLQRHPINLILCDIVMPDMSGLLFLQKLGSRIPVIMMTAYASVETARKAFKLGATDYLVKPFEFDELLVLINQKLDLTRHPVTSDLNAHLASNNPAFRLVLELAFKFSSTDMPILLTGESGTGKEVVADLMQKNSPRSTKPFVKLNCPAIPESLLESELFGYERGAFTGATSRKQGNLEEADGGSIFLDEIAELPMGLQAKLLRVLQDMTFSRLGGTEAIHLDTRIIAASNRDLEEEIRAGHFRSDLYHRLNGMHLHIPPLRERREDIVDMSLYFLDHFGRKYHKTIQGLEPDAEQALCAYRWPGNIRELRNSIERAVVVCETPRVQLIHLPDSLRNTDRPGHAQGSAGVVGDYRGEYIRRLLLDALNRTGGNRAEAARALNISRKTLYNWMKELKIHNDFS